MEIAREDAKSLQTTSSARWNGCVQSVCWVTHEFPFTATDGCRNWWGYSIIGSAFWKSTVLQGGAGRNLALSSPGVLSSFEILPLEAKLFSTPSKSMFCLSVSYTIKVLRQDGSVLPALCSVGSSIDYHSIRHLEPSHGEKHGMTRQEWLWGCVQLVHADGHSAR